MDKIGLFLSALNVLMCICFLIHYRKNNKEAFGMTIIALCGWISTVLELLN